MNRPKAKCVLMNKLSSINFTHPHLQPEENKRQVSSTERIQRRDFFNLFHTQNQNRNNLLRHLLNSLNREAISSGIITNPFHIFNIIDKESKTFLEWEYLLNSQRNLSYWKQTSRITLTQDNINAIISMTKDQIASESFLKRRIWMNNKLYLAMNDFDNKQHNDKQNPIILISRKNILAESFNELMISKEINLNKQIQIHFIDELARDIGGVFQEWYTCIMKEFIHPLNHLFELNTYSSINITSNKSNNPLYYQFYGKLLAKGLINNIILPYSINPIIIKRILQFPLQLSDLSYIDNKLYCSLLSLQSNPISSTNELYFVWNIRKPNGSIEEINLIPEGESIIINDNNKELFISKVIEYECYIKQKEEIDLIVLGFNELISYEYISVMSIEELDFVFSGQKTIDINDWYNSTVYKGKYYSSHLTIKLFWNVMKELNDDELLIFYSFCTGRAKVPIDGFDSLMGPNNQVQHFTIDSIQKDCNEFRLIEVNTCFNRIYLPNYSTKELMRKSIMTIINNDTNFFGLE